MTEVELLVCEAEHNGLINLEKRNELLTQLRESVVSPSIKEKYDSAIENIDRYYTKAMEKLERDFDEKKISKDKYEYCKKVISTEVDKRKKALTNKYEEALNTQSPVEESVKDLIDSIKNESYKHDRYNLLYNIRNHKQDKDSIVMWLKQFKSKYKNKIKEDEGVAKLYTTYNVAI